METERSDLLLDTLRRWWGYGAFRPLQREAIESVRAGRDTLVLLPTGGGKSLLYQLPVLADGGLALVITPLIALMKDQVDRLRSRGIAAVAVHSGMGPRAMDVALDNCVYGDMRFLYLSPERLTSEAFRLRLPRMPVRLIAVDEAHCIDQWGYDFRPAYLRIAQIRRLAPGVPVLALTATATPEVARQIMQQLQLHDPLLLRGDYARPNLSYVVRRTEDKKGQLIRLIRTVAGSGIVYIPTREGAERLAEELRAEGISAEFYHAGLPYGERSMRQGAWLAGRIRVMVATNAFGMGIDKPDVRFVVHYAPGDSPEGYYQEAGRAGRDGRRAYALLLLSEEDEGRIRRRNEAQFPPLDVIRRCYEALCNHLHVAVGDGKESTFAFNLHTFCHESHLYRGTVESALKILQLNGYLTLTEELENPARILFCVSRDDLYRIRIERSDMDPFIRTVLRLYDGVFTDFRPIDEAEVAAASGYTVERVKELLRRLWQLRIIRYIPANRSPLIFFNEERLPTADLYIAPETYKNRMEAARVRYEAMLSYARSEQECRSQMLERYFGQTDTAPCGVCDVCLARNKTNRNETGEERVLATLAAQGPMEVKALVAQLQGDPRPLLDAVARLHECGKISTGNDGKITIIG